jgi:HAD superfamily hydrolase (TIGR01484 family)
LKLIDRDKEGAHFMIGDKTSMDGGKSKTSVSPTGEDALRRTVSKHVEDDSGGSKTGVSSEGGVDDILRHASFTLKTRDGKSIKVREGGVVQERVNQIFLDSLDTVSPEKLERSAAVDHIATLLGEGNGGIVFDVDHTLIDPRKLWTMPKRWVEAAEIFQERGVTVGIITGRPIEAVDKALENAGPRGAALKEKIEIFGEYGDVHRGPSTNNEVRLTNKKSEKYVKLAKDVMNTIKETIHADPTLQNFQRRGILQADIAMTSKTLGGSVLGGSDTDELKALITTKAQQDKSINVDETYQAIYQRLNTLVSQALEKTSDFVKKDMVTTGIEGFDGIDIRINPNTTDLKLDKGNALAILVKDYKLRNIVACGDDVPDVAKEKRSRQLVTANDLIKYSLSKREERKILLRQELDKGFTRHLTGNENDKINEELLGLHKTTLQDHVFVGVEHPSDMKATEEEVLEAARVRVQATEGTVELAFAVASKLKERSERGGITETEKDAPHDDI